MTAEGDHSQRRAGDRRDRSRERRRPVQVGSHYHFYEATGPSFDREAVRPARYRREQAVGLNRDGPDPFGLSHMTVFVLSAALQMTASWRVEAWRIKSKEALMPICS